MTRAEVPCRSVVIQPDGGARFKKKVPSVTWHEPIHFSPLTSVSVPVKAYKIM